jgi:hypothetical protein
MSNVLLDLALSYVQARTPELTDVLVLDVIRGAFEAYIAGGPSAPVSTLLTLYANTTYPLDRVSAILQTPDDPLPARSEIGPPAAGRRKPRPWTPVEDERLLAAVHRYGVDNWTTVAEFVGSGRLRAQCAQRWLRGLDPRILKAHWTIDDEKRLLDLVRSHGVHGWTNIAAALGNRSDVQCRYHFHQMVRDGRLPPDVRQAVLASKQQPGPAVPLPTHVMMAPIAELITRICTKAFRM